MTPAAALARIPAHVLADLRRRYDEPERRYHSWAHIEALLRLYDDRAGTFHDPDAVLLAVLFHDAIYDAQRKDNEAASADLLMATALPGWSAASIAAARRMIQATAGHQPPPGLSPDEASDLETFLDMDLSILGASPDMFKQYQIAIRAEYAHVPTLLYRMGRGAILKGFLKRPSLYFTAWGRARFEVAARANLAHELGQKGGA